MKTLIITFLLFFMPLFFQAPATLSQQAPSVDPMSAIKTLVEKNLDSASNIIAKGEEEITALRRQNATLRKQIARLRANPLTVRDTVVIIYRVCKPELQPVVDTPPPKKEPLIRRIFPPRKSITEEPNKQ